MAFIQRHPALTYFALVFAISWGGVLIVVGPGGFPGTSEQFETLLPLAVVAMIAGPSIAGLLMTGLVQGRTGLRELLSRLLEWRAGARWYAAALLIPPTLMMGVLLALSLFSPRFLPGILVSDDKAALVLSGLAIALAAGIFEELGWTGFATPALRVHYGVRATGLIVGLIWAAWHWLVAFWASGTVSGALSLASYLLDPVLFLAVFRVLMVWVYDRTGSLFVGILMHASLTASARIIGAPGMAGPPLLLFDIVWVAAVGIVVAAVVPAGTQRSRHDAPARSGHGRAPAAQPILLALGIAAPLLYLASDALAGNGWAGYSFRDQTVSELNAIGSPARPLTIALGLAGYTLLLGFAVGVWRSARGNRPLRVIGGTLAIFAILALWAVPFASMHVRGAERSLTDTMHLVEGAIAVFLLVVAIGFGAKALGTRYRRYSIATILVLLAFGAWTAMDGARMAEGLPTPWLGFRERISVYSYQLWLVALAIALLRRHFAPTGGDMPVPQDRTRSPASR